VIFQVLRELLLNVVKHARTRNVGIVLRRAAEQLVVTVSDDGAGFDMTSMELRQRELVGFGLFSIRQKIEYLGGSVAIYSSPGSGTQVTLMVPMGSMSTDEENRP
jgi:signal transduction histidine kinase